MATQGATLAIQHIRELIRTGHIQEAREDTLQPSSLDLSISGEIYRMRGSFLPRRGERIRDILESGMLFPASLKEPLELNGIYLIRLREVLSLPRGIYATTNNKSSSGRINLQTRLIASGVPAFDYVPRGYRGELWLEVIPKSFPVRLAYGERLNQMRFFTGDARLSDAELLEADASHGLVYAPDGTRLAPETREGQQGVIANIDLSGADIVGYRCAPTMSRVLDYGGRDHDPLDFFKPIYRPKDGQLTLRRDEFYILVTKEGLRVPSAYSAEMLPYDVGLGEFRSHYAGFFDPGWGESEDGGKRGTQGVLEIFTHDRDFVLRDGQPICRLAYERLTAPADIRYGDERLTSNYYNQTGPRLSKHFLQRQGLNA